MNDEEKALAVEIYEVIEQMVLLALNPKCTDLRNANLARYISVLEKMGDV